MKANMIFIAVCVSFLLQTAVFAQDALPAVSGLPEGAILLFGEDPANPGVLVNRFRSKTGEKTDWKVEDGHLISTKNPDMPKHSNHAYADEFFKDALIHVEFMIHERISGNSGIYIHGNYEMQIIYTPEDKENPTYQDLGALYRFHAPKVNAGLPRGQWQTYEIDYTAPRRSEDGGIAEEGRITAWLNGQLVLEDVRFAEPQSGVHPFAYGTTEHLDKIGEQQKKTSVGPLFLQDHGSAVKFRNVWIKKKGD